ncbi:DUF5106 domain-containing protein [Fulvivirgaceae bacterium BMA12]|uniref:DUF5106 domain-containing protein n=1 Tax=Agaribacillus aureus TaxID=3051825 RepID=A0ABT8LEU0_9BACT|nr:DUF5106 domain-containing protein [Fulvivirgaceae bacterium BMA12]
MKNYLSVFALILPVLTFAQQGYKIDFQIEGLRDTTVYLGYYYGEGTYLKDTSFIDQSGGFSFEGKDKLPAGIYFTVLDKTRLFDFIIGKNQSFKISSNQKDYVQHLKSLNDAENELFFDHMKFIYKNNLSVQPYLEILKDSTANESAKQLAREKAGEIDSLVQKYQQALIDKNPGLLAAKLIVAQQALIVPEAIKQDRESVLKFYREHFWDGFDLSNDALLRFPQPIYRQKVEDYLGNLFPQDPDTLVAAINPLIEKAKKNRETYKYLIWNLTLNYQNPKIMGLDAIFVRLYDEYFASGEMDYWANDKLKENLKTRADQLRNSLIGKQAPNLIIQDLDGKPRALESIKSRYTVIYFYDPDCGFCKKETPKLRDFKKNTALDVNIYAVCADSSLTKMTKYIDEMAIGDWINVNGPRTYSKHYKTVYDANTTPTIYLLDERKKIIAKKIAADKIQPFLNNYEKNAVIKPVK